jgi:hypothetical protein
MFLARAGIGLGFSRARFSVAADGGFHESA